MPLPVEVQGKSGETADGRDHAEEEEGSREDEEVDVEVDVEVEVDDEEEGAGADMEYSPKMRSGGIRSCRPFD